MDDAGADDSAASPGTGGKMRVLLCGPIAASGGVATHTKKLADSLSRRGVRITIFNLCPSIQGSQLRMQICGVYRRTLGLMLEMTRNRMAFDIIHVQASGGIVSFVSAIVGCLEAKILHKRVVVTFHYSDTEMFIRKHRTSFGLTLSLADRMILVSRRQHSLITHEFSNMADKMSVIPNGYDERLFCPLDRQVCRRKLSLPESKMMIFNISNLLEHKGHAYLIDAIAKIVADEKNLLCVIAGRGPCKQLLEQQVRQHGLEDVIRLVGWIPDDEIPKWINASNVFVHPSLAEAMPVVMFESLACGVPFVGTRVGGIPEIVFPGEYGRIAEPGDAESLAHEITVALHHDWNRVKISEYALQFSWEKIAESTRTVYDNLANDF